MKHNKSSFEICFQNVERITDYNNLYQVLLREAIKTTTAKSEMLNYMAKEQQTIDNRMF